MSTMDTLVGVTFGLNTQVEEREGQAFTHYRVSDLSQASRNYWAYRGKLPQWQRVVDKIPMATMVTNPPLFGIEVETENVRPKRQDDMVPAGWSAKGDGSLRNGTEYVSKVASAIEARELVGSLYLFFTEQLRRQPDFSWRTSIHVHCNIRHLSVAQVANLQLLYSIFEFLLFRFVGGDRHKSNFCVPITETAQYIRIRQLLAPFVYGETALDRLNLVLGHWEKYAALNFCRTPDLGTVEFRHMAGTWDVVKLGNWLNLIGALQDAALRLDQGWIIEQINSLNSLSTYGSFRNSVFGPELGKVLGEPDNFNQLLSQGVSWAKNCLCKPPNEKHQIQAGSAAFKWAKDVVKRLPPSSEDVNKKLKKVQFTMDEMMAPLASINQTATNAVEWTIAPPTPPQQP